MATIIGVQFGGFRSYYISADEFAAWTSFGTFGVSIYWTYRQLKLRNSFVNQPGYGVFATIVLGWLCLMILLLTFPIVFIVTLDVYVYENPRLLDDKNLYIPIFLAGYLCFLLAIFLTIADSLGQKLAFAGLGLALAVPFAISFIYFVIFAGRSETGLAVLYFVAYGIFAYSTIRHSNLQRRSIVRYVAAAAFLMASPVAVSAGGAYLTFKVLRLDEDIYFVFLTLSSGPVLYLLATFFIQHLLHRYKTLPV